MERLFTIPELEQGVDLMALLPPYFRKIKDLIELMSTEQIELEILVDFIRRVYLNIFVQTCDEATIAIHEQMLEIIVHHGDTLDFRRARVLSRYNNSVPITLRSLKARLNALLGVGEWDLLIDYPNYIVDLIIKNPDNLFANEAVTMLITLIPAHLVIRYGLQFDYTATDYHGAALSVKITEFFSDSENSIITDAADYSAVAVSYNIKEDYTE